MRAIQEARQELSRPFRRSTDNPRSEPDSRRTAMGAAKLSSSPKNRLELADLPRIEWAPIESIRPNPKNAQARAFQTPVTVCVRWLGQGHGKRGQNATDRRRRPKRRTAPREGFGRARPASARNRTKEEGSQAVRPFRNPTRVIGGARTALDRLRPRRDRLRPRRASRPWRCRSQRNTAGGNRQVSERLRP